MSIGYSLQSYGWMLNDGVRGTAYDHAIREVVRPGDVVVEIGTGYGAFAMRAIQHGARHVYAIEPADSVVVGRELARRNGMADKITFFQALSKDVRLPERGDVLLSDIRGGLPILAGHFEAIADARARFLKPEFRIVAQRDRLFAAVVHEPELWANSIEPWGEFDYGVDMKPASDILANDVARLLESSADSVVLEGRQWGLVEYATIEPRSFQADLEWTAERSGVGHGIGAWFDTDLTPSISISNAPGQPRAAYGRQFFPFRRPLTIEPGDKVRVRIDIRHVRDDYVWTWTTRHEPHDGRPPAHFKQSTFFGLIVDKDWLEKHEAAFRPQRDPESELLAFVLPLMDGERTNTELAQRLREAFPKRVESQDDALEIIGKMSTQHSR